MYSHDLCMMLLLDLLTLCATTIIQQTECFTPSSLFHRPVQAQAVLNKSSITSAEEEEEEPRTIVITGATGRAGRLVVSQLLESTNHNMIALVHDETKTQELFQNDSDDNDNNDRLTILKCDLLNDKKDM